MDAIGGPQQTIDDLWGRMDAMVGMDTRKWWKCKGCGNKGYVAVYLKCGKCQEENWWGWYPK